MARIRTVTLFVFLSAVLFACGVINSGERIVTHGPITGAVSDTTATIWVRANSAPATVTLTPGGTQATFVAGADNTYKAFLAGLTPNTTYSYSISHADKEIGGGQFRTFASPGSGDNIRFLVLTDFFEGDGFAFQHAVSNLPFDFVVIGGDFWHHNCGTPATAVEFIDCLRSRFRDVYERTSDGWATFHDDVLSDYSLIHYWDDHDQGDNNTDKTFVYKTQALQVLLEYFPTYPTTPFGDWQQFTYGKADFFILDTRSQRDPNKPRIQPGKSMLDGDNLGADGQLEWLKNNLLNSAARWKFVFSPTTFNTTLKKKDAWWSYPDEHDAIVDFIEANNIEGVIFISGDLHAGGMDDGTNSGVPEMLVPGIGGGVTCLSANFPGTWSHGFYGQKKSSCEGYAIVDVSSSSVHLTIYDGDGAVKLTLTVD